MPNIAKSCAYAFEELPPTASLDERGRASYTIGYKIETTHTTPISKTPMAPGAAADDCLSGGTNPGPVTLPALWSTYSYQGATDSYAFLSRRTVRPLDADSRYWWLVEDSYEPIRPGETTGFDVAPTSRPVRYEFDREVYTEVIEYDINGNPVINSAKQSYDVDSEIERSRGVLVASYNVPHLEAVIALTRAYEGAVNKTAWKGLEPRQALCRDITSSLLQNEQGVEYYNVRLRIAIHQDKPEGFTQAEAGKWDRGILDRGFIAKCIDYEDDSETGEYGRILSDGTVAGSIDRNGVTIKATDDNPESPEPWNLNGSGRVIPKDQTPTGVFTFWPVHSQVDFNSKVLSVATPSAWSQTGIVPS